MKIRKAKESDKKRILELLNNSGNTGNDELHYEDNHVMEYIKGKAFETFVCEIDGKIAGVVMANIFPIAKYAEMYNIAIDENYRRKGIGLKLMDFLEDHLKRLGISIVYGYVNEDNKPSKNLVKKTGYEEGKRIIFYSKILE
jgi:ribosomal-protein-alanine N-acetyltransferase